MYTVSVDIGGTFTDVVVFDEANGRTVVGKSLTTPGDLRKGVIDGLKQTADDLDVPLNGLLAEAHRFVHATTQSSNAIFAFAGAKTAVVTTRGFGDTLTIMRATGRVAGLSVFERYHYRATVKPRMLADERDIFEVVERMDYAGRAVTNDRGLFGHTKRSGPRVSGGCRCLPLFPQERRAREARQGNLEGRAAERLRVAVQRSCSSAW